MLNVSREHMLLKLVQIQLAHLLAPLITSPYHHDVTIIVKIKTKKEVLEMIPDNL